MSDDVECVQLRGCSLLRQCVLRDKGNQTFNTSVQERSAVETAGIVRISRYPCKPT